MSDLVERLRQPGSGALWGPPITSVAADRIEHLEAALDLALGYLVQNEPGDSRAISNEFVAMAFVLADITDSRSQECLDIIAKASAELKELNSAA